MEAIMPSSIVGTMVALGMVVVGVSASGDAVAFEQPQVNASEILINRPEPPRSEEDTGNRERFRTLLFDERGQLRGGLSATRAR
jgi:hypothetical protein